MYTGTECRYDSVDEKYKRYVLSPIISDWRDMHDSLF
jgi:hypothetical protein